MTTPETQETLADALPREMQRVREILPFYKQIGPAGMFAVAMIEADLRMAEKAMMEGDVVGMLRAYESLKDVET